MSELPVLALIIWGTIVGLDLASVLQGLLSRPLVAGGIAGWIIGDPVAGLTIGGTLELFALDVLPVGSARYPDYGAATVAAVALGAWQAWPSALGPSVLLGLVLGQLGGWAIVAHRRVNAKALASLAPRLDRGDPGVAARLHLLGLSSDLARSATLAVLGLGAVGLLLRLPPVALATGHVLTLIVVAGGFVALVGGALRRAGTARRMLWLAGGLGLGLLSLGLR
ncbi:MAG TPA: PTS sugar transporter subunit IIC [Gemmatimonadales bacterium]|nr:PTS sugar transporter subunit IIC [Gemmatimonadales bacterium]